MDYMQYKESVKRYRVAAGNQFQRVSKTESYLRAGAWHLLSSDGGLLCVVHHDGTVVHGPMLQRIFIAQATNG